MLPVVQYIENETKGKTKMTPVIDVHEVIS